MATPNTVLATPFRSQRSEGASPAPFSTPGSVRSQMGSAQNLAVAVRDKLNINPDEAMETAATPVNKKQV